jgi:hypothetical protein
MICTTKERVLRLVTSSIVRRYNTRLDGSSSGKRSPAVCSERDLDLHFRAQHINDRHVAAKGDALASYMYLMSRSRASPVGSCFSVTLAMLVRISH